MTWGTDVGGGTGEEMWVMMKAHFSSFSDAQVSETNSAPASSWTTAQRRAQISLQSRALAMVQSLEMSVSIFPYFLKLIHQHIFDIRPSLWFQWTSLMTKYPTNIFSFILFRMSPMQAQLSHVHHPPCLSRPNQRKNQWGGLENTPRMVVEDQQTARTMLQLGLKRPPRRNDARVQQIKKRAKGGQLEKTEQKRDKRTRMLRSRRGQQ